MTILEHNPMVGLKNWVCVLIVVSTILTFSHADVPCPNPNCICENKTVTCKGHMSYIPPLPSQTKVLVFNNNYLPSITSNTFSNITNPKLNTILLSRCEIQNITSDALGNFNSTLEVLDLTGNTGIDKQQLSSSLKRLRRIKVLHLNQINMGDYLDSEFFEGMNGSELGAIHLQNNNLVKINDSTFHVFKRLKQLDLSKNSISLVELSGFGSLETLKFSFNKLNNVPNFCCLNGSSKFPNLAILKLDNNDIGELQEASWSCLTSLKELHLDTNKIMSLGDNVFSQLRKLTKLYLQFVKIEHISSLAFNNSNLRSLYLENCCKFGKDNLDYANLFQRCPNLQTLVLNSNKLNKVKETSFMSMLSPLNKLIDLQLQSTNRKHIPADLLKPLVSLRTLDLSSNLITEWPSTLFNNDITLVKLRMSKNKIKVIKDGYFPSSLMDKLTTLDLSGNPFDCSCENLWLRRWMNNILLKKPDFFSNNYPKFYNCSTPFTLQGTLLKSYNPSDEDCRPWGHVLMDILITSSTVVIVFSLLAVLYIQRWNIRYILHAMLKRRMKYTPLKEADFQYDVYVAYSDKDRQWIRDELWKKLENEKGFKLYIRDKSEDPGVAKCDSIVDNMYASRKSILVISRNFMSCPWCQYQLQVAQNRSVQVGSDWLIPVVLGDLKIRHVTKSLHMLLKQRNVITWSEEENGKQLFWLQLLASIENCRDPNDVIGDDSLTMN